MKFQEKKLRLLLTCLVLLSLAVIEYVLTLPVATVMQYRVLPRQVVQHIEGKLYNFNLRDYDPGYLEEHDNNLYISIKSSGSVQGFMPHPIRGQHRIDRGRWWVENDALCFKWRHWKYGEKCLVWYDLGTRYLLLSKNGKMRANVNKKDIVRYGKNGSFKKLGDGFLQEILGARVKHCTKAGGAVRYLKNGNIQFSCLNHPGDKERFTKGEWWIDKDKICQKWVSGVKRVECYYWYSVGPYYLSVSTRGRLYGRSYKSSIR